MLVAGAALLAAAAAAMLAFTGVISLPFLHPSNTQLLKQINEAAMTGGYSLTFSQADNSKWQLGEGHKLERFGLDGADAAFARLTSNVPLNATTWEWSTQGLSAELPVEFNNRTNGQKIEIGVVARASAANSSNAVTVVYATQQAGNSGWHDLRLSSDFSLQTFVFDVPKRDPGSYDKMPIIVLNSDRSGGGKAVEIMGVYVKPVLAN